MATVTKVLTRSSKNMARVTPTAQAAPAAPSAKPGTEAPQAAKIEKKVKKNRLFHPALEVNAEGKPTKRLEAWPADFDPKVHKPLKRGHFANEGAFLIAKAERLEKSAADLRQEAKDIAEGKPGKGGKAGKLMKMLSKVEEMRAELESEGVDINAIVAAVKAKQAAAKEAAAKAEEAAKTAAA